MAKAGRKSKNYMWP